MFAVNVIQYSKATQMATTGVDTFLCLTKHQRNSRFSTASFIYTYLIFYYGFMCKGIQIFWVAKTDEWIVFFLSAVKFSENHQNIQKGKKAF